jgi:hypothetical protein
MLIELMKVTGRKFAWAYAALFSLWSLAALAKLDSAGFQISFAALVGAVMAANYGENREKARASKEAKPDAPPAKP